MTQGTPEDKARAAELARIAEARAARVASFADPSAGAPAPVVPPREGSVQLFVPPDGPPVLIWGDGVSEVEALLLAQAALGRCVLAFMARGQVPDPEGAGEPL